MRCSFFPKTLYAVALTPALLVPLNAQGNSGFRRWGVEFEAGPYGFTRNDVRIPGDTGTRFSMLDLNVKGPEGYLRIYGEANVNRKHGFRVLYAPLQAEDTGRLSQSTVFAGATFAPGVSTTAVYRFNTYRFTYRYTFKDSERWQLRVGAAGLVRDAKIELQQEGRAARKTDLGAVPLAYFSAQYNLTDRAHLLFDFEGLGAPQGRALDGILKFTYDLTNRWTFGVGYRALEGGADNDEVYNFSWLHYGAFSLGYRW